MANKETAVIVGVGPGLGAALTRRFSTADFIVAIAARDQSKLHAIASAIGPDVHAYHCDVTEEDRIERLFQAVEQDLGAPGVAIHNAEVETERIGQNLAGSSLAGLSLRDLRPRKRRLRELFASGSPDFSASGTRWRREVDSNRQFRS
jgi:NAD(P)-dependent dehydrogenase (short-subunit alcohol dehydrogenase family)